VAELIADGLTNRQIAARLFVSERTVDTHVSRILAKLGCATRAQVAAIIASGAAAAYP
jgi:DNA-binding NarL/FixJ family response regulator